ncbi:MAG: MFS transporter [Acidocella sp.]|nr:MFS transporter [Acidocella sp.]
MTPGSAAVVPGQVRTLRFFYFMAGMGVSTWAIIVPFTKIRFALDDATLGYILLAPGVGGILAMPAMGYLLKRFGSRTVLLACGAVFGVVLPLLTIAPGKLAFTALLFVFGVSFGGIDVGVNAQAVVMEGRSGRRLMSSFHALFSFGALAVALATSLLLKLGLSNFLSAVCCAAGIFIILLQGGTLAPKSEDLLAEGPALAWPDRATLALGLCCFVCFLTEGAVTDWSTILLRFSRGASVVTAPFGYAAFAVMMALARLAGDWLAIRIGAARLVLGGCLLASAGILLAVSFDLLAVDVLGFAMVGLGIGNMAPLIFSATARIPEIAPTASAPAVISLGYAGFLLGPVVIGFIANQLTLAIAMGLVAVLLVVISFAARAVEPV